MYLLCSDYAEKKKIYGCEVHETAMYLSNISPQNESRVFWKIFRPEFEFTIKFSSLYNDFFEKKKLQAWI